MRGYNEGKCYRRGTKPGKFMYKTVAVGGCLYGGVGVEEGTHNAQEKYHTHAKAALGENGRQGVAGLPQPGRRRHKACVGGREKAEEETINQPRLCFSSHVTDMVGRGWGCVCGGVGRHTRHTL